MRRPPLTDRAVQTATTGTHPDSATTGLYLEVDAGGSRSWLLRTIIMGKRRWMGLGGYPLVSLKEARKKAQEYRAIARDGGDPFVLRDKAKKIVPTFRQAAEKVHAEHAPSWKNEKHRQQFINTLRDYAFPALEDMRVDAVRSGDILQAINPIWLDKPETARRVLQRIGTVLVWAKGHGYRSDSPLEEIAGARKALPKQRGKPKHHKALHYSAVATFISNLRGADTSDPVKLAFEYLVLTATRSGEVLLATWPEIDLDARVWVIPSSRMKAQREHRVPLPDRCIEILTRARGLSHGDSYVFPGAQKGKPLSNMMLWRTLRKIGIDATAHGFRSSFRDWCSEQTNVPREVAEAALAHAVEDRTEAAYRRTDLFERRRQLMMQWSGYIALETARVLPIRSAM